MSKFSLLPRAKPEDWLRPSVLALKSPALGLVLLVVLKVLLDLRAHLAERAKFASGTKAAGATTTPF